MKAYLVPKSPIGDQTHMHLPLDYDMFSYLFIYFIIKILDLFF